MNTTTNPRASELTIYVASRASVPARPEMWKRLRAQGWPISSTWIDEAGEGETGDFQELWQRIHDEIAASCGVILYAEESDFPLKGAYIECGMALGMGKPVAIVLKFPLMDRSMRPLGSWANHPLVKLCQSLDQARNYVQLARAAIARQATPEAPTYRALQRLENPYNEKDHGPGWQVAVHAWDMAIVSAMRIARASTVAAPEAPASEQQAMDAYDAPLDVHKHIAHQIVSERSESVLRATTASASIDCPECGFGAEHDPGCARAAAPSRDAAPLNDSKLAAYLRNEPWISAYIETLECELRKAQAPHAGAALDADTQAARDVLAERRRQIEAEGWTPEHDDEHDSGELSLAAACYAVAGDSPHGRSPNDWPWDESWWKPSDDRRNLIKAAALILADIERIDRAAMSAAKQGEQG